MGEGGGGEGKGCWNEEVLQVEFVFDDGSIRLIRLVRSGDWRFESERKCERFNDY